MKKRQIAITLGVMCALLTFAIVLQINTIDAAAEIVGVERTENKLKDQVLEQKEKYDKLYATLEKTEKELEEIRQEVTKGDSSAEEAEEELRIANILLGLTEVSGSGIIIKLDDNQTVTAESIGIYDNISRYLIHDEDLRTIVNELKNAGAEAISINGQRIVSTTAITCDGNVILINGEKVGAPFEIKAIGFQEMFIGALLRPGGYIEVLENDGIITSVEKQDKVTIPKYNGILGAKSIKESK